MNNNTFQVDRFWKLIVRNLKSLRKYWVQSLLIVAGFPLLFFLINLSQIGMEITLDNRTSFLNSMVSTLVIISPFMLFINYNHPKKGLTEVMLGASVLEKYLVMQLACLVFTPLAIVTIYGCMDSLLVLLFPTLYKGHVIQQILQNSVDWQQISTMLLLQQGVFFFNLLFVRRKVLKTVGVFILAMIAMITAIVITISIWESIGSTAEFNNLYFDLNDRALFAIYANDHPIVVILQVTRIIIQVILPLAFFSGSYFVLKNKRY